MRIREFSSRSDGLAKRPREVFTSKQRLMHGSELSREVRQVKEIQPANGVKPAEKKQRRSFKDAIKMLAGGAAAAAVVVVSAPTAAPVPERTVAPYVLEKYDEHAYKYQYAVSFPTYRETLEPGGYAVVLDVSTEEKKQALYDFYAESIYEFLRFADEKGEEFINDPGSESLFTCFLSETEDNGIVGSIGHHSSTNNRTKLDFGYMHLCSGTVMGYYGVETKIQHANSHFSSGDGFYPNLFYISENPLGLNDFSAAKETYGNKTQEKILELITEPLDRYLLDIKSATDGTRWTNLHYETMGTLTQFTIAEGKADIIMPEFFKVIRDDEVYGWKTLTVPESGDYMLVTGSDEYPADKPYAYDFSISDIEPLNAASYGKAYFNYDWEYGTQWIFFPTTAHAHKNTTYNRLYSGMLELSDFVYSQSFDDPQSSEPQDNAGTQHIYYDLAAFNAAGDTEITVLQLGRLLPIEDKYYLYKLGGSSTYTITNNGDHEVVVIGNLASDIDEELDQDNIRSVNYRYNDGAMGQFFNYEPLLPGESLTIFSSTIVAGDRGAATLTMPECCTVVDSMGDEYFHTGIEIDLLKGTTKED